MMRSWHAESGRGTKNRYCQHTEGGANQKQITMDEKIIGLLQAIAENTALTAKKMLTTEDVVKLTGLSAVTLRNMRCQREIPYYKLTNKIIYYDREEIENWMRRNRVNTVEEGAQSAVAFTTRKPKA